MGLLLREVTLGQFLIAWFGLGAVRSVIYNLVSAMWVRGLNAGWIPREPDMTYSDGDLLAEIAADVVVLGMLVFLVRRAAARRARTGDASGIL